MRGFLPYAWRSLTARPARTLLTIAGVALGVGVLVAALGVSAGLDASIDRTASSLVGRADVRVGTFTEQGLSPEAQAAIDAVPGVALAAPGLERRTFLGPSPDRPGLADPVTVLGIDVEREPRVRDLDPIEGRPLAGGESDGVLVTQRLAAEEGLVPGSDLALLGAGAPVQVHVVGILAGDGPAAGSAGRTIVAPLATAARLAAPEDPTTGAAPGAAAPVPPVTRVDVVLAAGADPGSVIRALEAALTTEPYTLTVPADVRASLRASTADIRSTIALLAAITLFTAAFLILNTLSMTVVERVRELGLLRAAGAGRGQVVRVVLAQALVLGLAGSLAGIAAGAVLALGITRWLQRAGDVALDGPVFTTQVVGAGLAVGVAITLVAAVEPARRAAGVSPVTVLRSRSDARSTARARTGWLVAVAAALLVLAVLVLPVGEGAAGVARPVAVYAMLLGVVLLTPMTVRPLGWLAGRPFGLLLRLEERLARASIGRDRTRTALTVGALTVGLAMVVALGAVAANARQVATAWLSDVVPGDEILTAVAPVPVGEGDIASELLALDGVARATPIATFDLAFRGTRLEAAAVVGSDLDEDGRLTFLAGDRTSALAALDHGGAVILPRSRAERLGAGVGDVLAVATRGGLVELRVVGVVDRSIPGRSGEAALVGWQDALDHFGVAGADALAVRFAPDAPAATRVAVAAFATERALTVSAVSQVEGSVSDALDRVFGLLDLLALAAVVVAGLGIVNTLSIDVWERVREIGVLRAAGMSRRQVWRSVLVEAGILGTIGAVVGSLVGLAVGFLLVVTAGGRPSPGLDVPWATIGIALVLGIGLAMIAAAQPARLAGRRSIVSAVRLD